MIAANPSSSCFAKHVKLLLELHKLIAQGKGDDRPADEVRDEMDTTWRGLSNYDRHVVEGLSADLYTLTDPPIVDVPLIRSVAEPIQHAISNEDWPKALELIRENEKRIPTYAAAYWRGLCWGESGYYSVAAEFFERAARLAPQVELFWECLVVSLVLDQREDEALRIINERTDAPVSPRWYFTSADVVLLNAETATEMEMEKIYRRAIELVERGIQSASQVANTSDLLHSITAAQLRLAISYDYLGKTVEAQAAAAAALRLEPNNLDAMLVSGFIGQQKNQRDPAAYTHVLSAIIRAPHNAAGGIRRAALRTSTFAPSISA